MPPAKPLAKIAAALLLIAALIIAFRVLPVADWLRGFQTYVRGLGALGYVLYIAVYAVCVVALVPASILTLGAGPLFGFVGGTIVVVIGATLGAALAFVLARTIFRQRVERTAANNAKFLALDRAISAEGMRIVFLVRLAVVFPFTWVNYLFGLTAISFWRYLAATFLGIIPATAAAVFVSSAATSAATPQNGLVTKVVYIGGAAVALGVSIFIGRIATRAIKRAGVDSESGKNE